MTKEEILIELKGLPAPELVEVLEIAIGELDDRSKRKLRLVSVGERLPAVRLIQKVSGFGLQDAVVLMGRAPCDVPIVDGSELDSIVRELLETGSVVELP